MAALYPGEIFDNLDAALRNGTLDQSEFLKIVDELHAALVALGLNPQGASGTVRQRLDTIEATQAVAGTLGVCNLRVANNTATKDSKVDITADAIAVEGTPLSAVAVTLDLTVDGLGGFDNLAADAEDPNTWYHVWLGHNPSTGVRSGCFSKSYTRAGLVLGSSFDGFTKWRRVGAAWNNGSSNLARFFSQDGRVAYSDDSAAQLALNAASVNASFASLSLANFIPPTARIVTLMAQLAGTSNGAFSVLVRQKGLAGNGVPLAWVPVGAGTVGIGRERLATDTTQAVEWKTSAAPAGGTVSLAVTGYEDSV